MNGTQDQTHSESSLAFMVADWHIDPSNCCISRGSESVQVESRVMDVLLCLAEHPGVVIPRREIESTVWPDMILKEDALASAINRLRRVFGDDADNPEYIESINDRGFRLIAQVMSVTQHQESESLADVDEPNPHRLPSPYRWSVFLMVMAVFIVLLSILDIGNAPEPEKNIKRPNLKLQQSSIVVLPFTNKSDDAKQVYFSDGITHDLINELSKISSLTVIARRSAFMYRGKTPDIKEVGKKLSVNYVLKGSVRRYGDDLFVNVNLFDAHTGTDVWAHPYDLKINDLFSVQNNIRDKILTTLAITLTDKEIEQITHRYSNSVKAYDTFLYGQSIYVNHTREDNRKARLVFQQAIDIDPDFARAHSALALTHADDFRFNWSKNIARSKQLAIEIAERALTLDSWNPQVHWIMAYIYLFNKNDHSRAIQMGEKTIKLDPNNADGLTLLAAIYTFAERPTEAKTLVEKAMRLNPAYPSQYPSVIALAELVMGNYVQAHVVYKEALAINQYRINPNSYMTVNLMRLGRYADATFQAGQLLLLNPKFKVAAWASRQPFQNKTVVRQMVKDLYQAGLK